MGSIFKSEASRDEWAGITSPDRHSEIEVSWMNSVLGGEEGRRSREQGASWYKYPCYVTLRLLDGKPPYISICHISC
jgi:hypothetical protein